MVRPRRRARGNVGNRTGGPQVDPLQIILDRLDQQQRTIDQMQEVLTKRGQDQPRERARRGRPPVVPQAAQQQPNPPVDLEEPVAGGLPNQHQWVTQFGQYHPPSFDGHFDIQVAEDWILRLEKIFKIMGCTSELKAVMAIYMLIGEADRWWRTTEMILKDRNIPVTWEVFLEHFYEKYFPRSARDEKEAEFIMLKQAENESIDEYVAKYIRLSKYSTYLQQHDDERWNTEKFERSLKPTIRERVAPMRIRTFNAMVEVCRIIENSLNHGRSMASEPPRNVRPNERGSLSRRGGRRPWSKRRFKKSGQRGGSNA